MSKRVEQRVFISCDHYRYDSATLHGDFLMAGVAWGSLGCPVEAGSFSSEQAATQSTLSAGWLLLAHRSGQTLYFCPLHAQHAKENLSDLALAG